MALNKSQFFFERGFRTKCWKHALCVIDDVAGDQNKEMCMLITTVLH
ncbi:hypothetical protein BR10RB9215_C10540 [Brucella sp. 10RB9215]|nr:hypothetical protein BR10RB9215_C10540 [Brucella sp. 10RB9215]